LIKIYKLYYKNNIYVGATTKALSKRLKQHRYYSSYEGTNKRSKALYNSKLYETMRKHGSSEFKIELLAEAQTIENARDLETYYINKISTLNRSLTSGFTINSKVERTGDKQIISELKEEIKILKKDLQFWKDLSLN